MSWVVLSINIFWCKKKSSCTESQISLEIAFTWHTRPTCVLHFRQYKGKGHKKKESIKHIRNVEKKKCITWEAGLRYSFDIRALSYLQKRLQPLWDANKESDMDWDTNCCYKAALSVNQHFLQRRKWWLKESAYFYCLLTIHNTLNYSCNINLNIWHFQL